MGALRNTCERDCAWSNRRHGGNEASGACAGEGTFAKGRSPRTLWANCRYRESGSVYLFGGGEFYQWRCVGSRWRPLADRHSVGLEDSSRGVMLAVSFYRICKILQDVQDSSCES